MRNRSWRTKWKAWLAGALAMCMAAGLLAMPTGMARAQEQEGEEAVAQESQAAPQADTTGEAPESDFTYYAKGAGVEIYEYKGAGGAVKVPSMLGGKQVISIKWGAFDGCSSLTSIELPAGLTSIGGAAFSDCSSLRSIKLPAGLTSINYATFDGCSSLSSIELPDSLTSIGWGAFRGCSSLSSIELPAGLTSIELETFSGCSRLSSIELSDDLTSIERNAFSGCSSLSSIKLPAGLTSIGEMVFSGCSSLSSIELPDGLTSIGWGAFSGCSSLSGIKLPVSLTRIGGGAFRGCSSLSGIELPAGLTSIEQDTFSGCSSLSSIKLPAGLTSIDWEAFSGCSSLSSIELPAGLTSIRDGAFSGCSSLSSIELPAGLTSIGFGAFAGCNGLNSFIVAAGNEKYRAEGGVLYTKDGSKLVAYPSAKGSVVISDGVTSIDFSAFSGCSSLSSIELPDGLSIIEGKAFYGCSSLESVVIPASVTRIGDLPEMQLEDFWPAFEKCEKLKVINYTGSEEQWKKVENFEIVGCMEAALLRDLVSKEIPINYNYVRPGFTSGGATGGDSTGGDSTSGGATGGGATGGDSTSGGATGGDSTSPDVKKPVLPTITETTVTSAAGKKSAPAQRKDDVPVKDAPSTLLSRMDAQEKPEVVTKVMAPTVDASVFKAAKEKKKDITFSVTNDAGDLLYSWSFSGKNLDPSKVTQPMDLTMSFESAKKGEIEEKTGVKGAIGLYLSIDGYKGELPGPATVRTYVGDKYANGATVYVYYYNEDKQRAELPVSGTANACKVENGYITYTLTHCSIYFVSDQTPARLGIESPKTGEGAMDAWALAMAASAVMLACLWRKRERFAR